MTVDVSWMVPRLRRAGFWWNAASSLTVAVVGFFAKVFIGRTAADTGTTVWLNKTTVFNKNRLIHALERRPTSIPLITVSNHHSCFDDPGLWGILPIKYLCLRNRLRWALAAHDICFTKNSHSIFFMLGKCIPVVRGQGVNQPAIDFCIEKLKQGEWVHIFPEGKVNMSKEPIRLKWGIGRLIYESPVTPIVIPIWHEGMDDILPNSEPYIPQFGKKLTINFGEPLNFEDMVNRLKKVDATPEEARKAITDYIQEQLYQLKYKTLQMIEENSNNNIKKKS